MTSADLPAPKTAAKKKKRPGCCSCCCLLVFIMLVVVPVGSVGFAYWYFRPPPSPVEQEYQSIPDYFPPPSKAVSS